MTKITFCNCSGKERQPTVPLNHYHNIKAGIRCEDCGYEVVITRDCIFINNEIYDITIDSKDKAQAVCIELWNALMRFRAEITKIMEGQKNG